MGSLQPGDVATIRTADFAGCLIRLGERLMREPDGANHVAVYIKQDPLGRPWGIEGRPSGVGWVNLTGYRIISTNIEQPKTPQQRASIVAIMSQLLGTGYDWRAIVADAGLACLHAIDLAAVADRLQDLWKYRVERDKAPGQVVCSSLASWAYVESGCSAPNHGSLTFPSDWDSWNKRKKWIR